MTNYNFVSAFNSVAKQVHETAREKGWWDEERSNAEALALIHSEISEALEYLRKGQDATDDKIPAFLGVEAELADVIIRIMDLAHARDWCVAEALVEKMHFNKSRERKHGKLF